MEWPVGTKVEHEFLGAYTINGPSFVNEIGYTLVPVLSETGTLCYFHPKNLKVSGHTDGQKGGISRTPGRAKNPLSGESRGKKGGKNGEDSIGKHGFAPHNLPGVQESLF